MWVSGHKADTPHSNRSTLFHLDNCHACITFPSKVRYSKRPHPLKLCRFLTSAIHATFSTHFDILDLITLIIFVKEFLTMHFLLLLLSTIRLIQLQDKAQNWSFHVLYALSVLALLFHALCYNISAICFHTEFPDGKTKPI
jgi:hypothetical protein